MTKRDLENLYVLSPLQQGLLFHSLYSPASGLYVDQFILELQGELRPDLLERAWQLVVSRHGSLRTSFHWENLDRPLQVVLPHAQLPFAHYDWQDLSSAAQEERLNDYLRVDRERGFQLSEAPLMRLVLIRSSNDLYRLIWSVHHIILDAWSASIVQNEVLLSYAAFLQEESPSLQAGTPFSDYISWLRQQDLSPAETFWRGALVGFTSPTRLPIDNGTGDLSQTAEDEADLEIRLSQVATSRVAAFAQRHQLTLNTVLQGAWSLLLQRYSGEQEVVFGVTVSGRAGSIPGVENIVGNLLNTLPFRVKFSSKDVLTFLMEIQDWQLQLRDYEYSPLTEIQKWSELPSNEPLFDSILVFENAPSVDLKASFNGSIQIGPSRHLFRTNYPLTVQVIPGPNLFIRIRADHRRFSPESVRRMLGHLETLLDNIVANPSRSVSTLPLLSEAELKQVLSWNSTKADYPQISTVHELFEQQAATVPDAVAVVYQDERLTYGELNRRANQLAHYLRKREIGPESLIGICLERSVEMIVGILGTLKAGAAYVPLDPSYPPQRLSFMLEDARVPVLLTQERLREQLPAIAAEVVSLDVDWDEIALERDENPGVKVDGQHPVYVIYTSGSTGTPKGVMVKQGSLVNLCYGLEEFFADPRVRHTALITSISFDISVNQIFPSLVFGRTLHVIANEVKYDPAAFLEYVAEREIDLFDCVPSYLNSVLREQASNQEIVGAALGGRPSVGKAGWEAPKYILVGGEKVERSLLEKVFERWGGEAALVNIYGLTEITDINTLSVIRQSDHNEVITIGRPLQNTRVYITDEHYNLQPVGIGGELCVAGDGVSRGYLNRPELTADKFVPAPWEAGQVMCRTGDMARRLEDGRIELLGRRDQQVKIRGYRVEVGEIEVMLESHPKVKEAVVVMREDTPGDKRLVAYLASAADGALTAELPGFLKEKLPEYMVPSAFVMLEEMPHLPNGKINRNSLPPPFQTKSSYSTPFAAPRNPVEELLVSLWSAVLPMEKIGIHDDFFDLGGHSLLATQFVSRAREAFKIDLPLHILFDAPTVAELAERIEPDLRAGLQPAPELQPFSRDENPTLSFAQQRMWILDQFESEVSAYNLALAIVIKGALDLSAVKQSLDEIIARHETLRTSFQLVEGQPIPVIAPPQGLNIEITSLRDPDKSQQTSEVHRLAAQELQERFDLSKSPLLRARLLILSEDEHVLLLTMHHIVSDGWSIGVFFSELAALYEAFSSGRPSPLAALPIQYADYAAWQRQWLKGEVLENQLAYWRRQLADAPSGLELPCDHSRPAVQTFRGRRQTVTLPRELSEGLNAFSRDERVTLFMTLLAAFKVLLHRYTGETDLLVGSPIANRKHVETEKLIGFFVNTLVLRTRISSSLTFRELLNQVKETALEAYAHQDVPFEKLVEELQPVRNLSHAPLFQVVFALQNMPLPALELNELSLNVIEVESTTAKFDLVLFVIEKDNELACTFEYNRDLFEPATITRMMGHFQTLLTSIVADPTKRIAELPLLTQEEQEKLLVEWNDTRAHYPKHASFSQLFEQQAATVPDAVAVVYQEERLTYGELNRRANQLAHYLRKREIGPESLIGICLERSVEMIVGILGTLKAGAAYVPLDPSYPPQRLSFMLEDARVPVLLTQERLREQLPAIAAEVVSLDVDWDEIARERDKNPGVEVDGQHPVYVIYTSGSTGTPKGVMVKQGSLVNLCYGLEEFFADPRVRHTALITSISFDISVNQIFPSLVFGRTLHVIANEVKYDPAAFLEYVAEQEIDLFDCVPSYLSSVLREGKHDESSSGVKYILVGGEKVERSLLEKVFERWGGEAALVNIYGLTEITDINTLSVIRQSDHNEVITIGRPLQNTRVYITDEHYNLQPVGISGELCVAGDGVSRGYLNRPELTAEKFVPVPWEAGQVMCRTGDMARWLEDGRIELLGRRDQQVKIRGYRVEVGEIEVMLESHPEVKEAVVVMREDTPGDKRLVAYLASAADGALTAKLSGFLKERLPEYMVPSAFVMLEEMPHLPNGKINRNSLPAPETIGSESLAAYVAPQNELEQILAGIWQDVLQATRVGIYDNFFSDLGGNSLMLIQVVGKLREALNRDISMIEMFQFPTIHSFAQHLATSKSETPSVDETADRTINRRQVMQQRRQLKQQRRTMTAEQGASG